ncbi:MAG: type II toxin-antitoxin system VapC family toxin [Thermomicrobiales bacterium]
MMVVDASVCVSLLLSEDVHHDTSLAWLQPRLVAGWSFFAPSLLIAEVAGGIARRTGLSADGHRAVAGLRELMDIALVPLDLERAAMSARLAADLRLRGADATYVAIALEVGVPLVTWDREQLTRAAEIISVFTPASAHQDELSS